MYIYCDCRNKNGELDIPKASLGRGLMLPTRVNKEGICRYCGYYAILSKEEKLQFTSRIESRGDVNREHYADITVCGYLNQE
jgi:hypothetical protein